MNVADFQPNQQIIPRAPRHDVDIYADIEGPTVHAFRSRVLNISASGMLLAEAGQLRIGDVVRSNIPDKSATLCTIVRLKNGRAGVRFEG
jgi:hypothetical protein